MSIAPLIAANLRAIRCPALGFMALLLGLCGCDVFVKIPGRTFATQDPAESGIWILDSEPALHEAPNGSWPRRAVQVGDSPEEGATLTDEDGFFVHAFQTSHIFGVPLGRLTVHFSGKDVVPIATSVRASDVSGKYLRVVLLELTGPTSQSTLPKD